MNTNSDDDAADPRHLFDQHARTSSVSPPSPPYSSGIRRARTNPESRYASKLSHGYSSRSSASAACGRDLALGEAPERGSQLIVLVGESIDAPTIRRRGRTGALELRRGTSTSERASTCGGMRQHRDREPRRRSRGAPRTRASAPCDRVRRATSTNAGSTLALVAEQRRRRSRRRASPAPARTTPPASSRARAMTASASSARSCGAEREPVAQPLGERDARTRRSGPGARAARPVGWPGLEVAGAVGAPRAAPAGMCTPGARFCS